MNEKIEFPKNFGFLECDREGEQKRIFLKEEQKRGLETFERVKVSWA